MSQPPTGQLPPWERPQWQQGAQPAAEGAQPAPYGAPQYGAPQYGAPQYGQAQYGQAQYGQPQYGQPPYGTAEYGAPQYGQPQYGQPSYGQYPYGQQPAAYPYGQQPYGQYPYGPPRRRSRAVLIWSIVGGVALLALIVGVVVAVSGSGGVRPAPAATREPTGLGSDPVLDQWAQQCHDGTMSACDDLYDTSDLDSAYEDYGDTCAGRRGGGEWDYCADVFSDTDGSTD